MGPEHCVNLDADWAEALVGGGVFRSVKMVRCRPEVRGASSILSGNVMNASNTSGGELGREQAGLCGGGTGFRRRFQVGFRPVSYQILHNPRHSVNMSDL